MCLTFCVFLVPFISIQGHNLGLYHANEIVEYADQSGLMGFGYPNEDDSPAMCFNGAKSWQLGWYNTSHVELSLTTGSTWTGDLFGVVDFDPSLTAGQNVIVRFGFSQGLYYYVMFNLAEGFNKGTKEGANQVLVTQQYYGYSSQLLAKLSEGDLYEQEDVNLDGDTLTISVEEIDLDAVIPYATVTICKSVELGFFFGFVLQFALSFSLSFLFKTTTTTTNSARFFVHQPSQAIRDFGFLLQSTHSIPNANAS